MGWLDRIGSQRGLMGVGRPDEMEREGKEVDGRVVEDREDNWAKRGHGCLKKGTQLSEKENWLQRGRVIAGEKKKRRFLEGKTTDRV